MIEITRPLTIVTGKNGAGKSQLLKGIKFSEPNFFNTWETIRELLPKDNNDRTVDSWLYGMHGMGAYKKASELIESTGGYNLVAVLLHGIRTRYGAEPIFFNHPEAGLHPSLQAELAEYFIHMTDPARGNTRMVVETHSELLILRILRRIRETHDTNDPNLANDGTVVRPAPSPLYPNQVDIINVIDGVAYHHEIQPDGNGFTPPFGGAGFFRERAEELL